MTSLQVWERQSAPAATTGKRAIRERLSGPMAILTGILVVLGLVLGFLLWQAAHRPSDLPLDPDNPGRAGTKAAVEVLRAKGVRVDVARSDEELRDLDEADGQTVVVVTDTHNLGESTLAGLERFSREARRVVLLEPSYSALELWGLGVQQEDPPETGLPEATDRVSAGCVSEGLSRDDAVSTGSTGYSRMSDTPGTDCFTVKDSSALVILPAAPEVPETWVFGPAEALTNRHITRFDNAGVTLRMLGAGDRVVWYMPTFLDLVEGEETASDGPEIPAAVGPLTLLALLALVTTMLWRGRRLGRLVPEPLPAVVKAIETTQSRGRMYHRAGDPARSAAILRVATRGRLSTYLGVPADAGDEALVDAVARACARPHADVRGLLVGTESTDERHLIQLAQNLSALEKDVHRP
ncbi:MAG: DUF4350 domain-containing protein [Micrococcales bacterium]|nr:DUF4350 domain-containing protein [Micrococcales bacterium]